jgi:probable F420-dependent oxidoreductase
MTQPFCFGAYAPSVTSGSALTEFARKAEALGYGEIAVGEHGAFGVAGPLVTLASIAAATTTLQLTANVFNNELRHPALLAGELAMLDQISNGRAIIGLGVGWLRDDFDALGVPFARGADRVTRLEEAVDLMKRLFRGETVTMTGSSYPIKELSIQTGPFQQPHLPFFIGGGGRRLLRLAAHEAHIVGYNPNGLPGGGLDFATSTAEAYDQKLAWVKEAAGERFDQLTFHANMLVVTVTDDRQRGAEQTAAWFAPLRSGIAHNLPDDPYALLSSPHVLVGSIDQICAELQERRERHGISRITIPSQALDDFAPVVARLAGV